jgi:hypothetical protein
MMQRRRGWRLLDAATDETATVDSFPLLGEPSLAEQQARGKPD